MPQVRQPDNKLLQTLIPKGTEELKLIQSAENYPTSGLIVQRAKNTPGRKISVEYDAPYLSAVGDLGQTVYPKDDKSLIMVHPHPGQSGYMRLGRLVKRQPPGEEILGHELGHALGSRLIDELGYNTVDQEFMSDLAMSNPTLDELKAAVKRYVGQGQFYFPDSAYGPRLARYGDLLHGILGEKSRLLGGYEEPNMSRMK